VIHPYPSKVNRQRRRTAERASRRIDAELTIAPSKAILVQVVAELAAEDPTVSGVTIIMPDGEVSFITADILRRPGRA
jgi:hypothetical protein